MLCMRVDLPLDKKLWKIRIGPLGCSGPRAGRPLSRRAAGLPRAARATGPHRPPGRTGRRAARLHGPPGCGPVFSKTLRIFAEEAQRDYYQHFLSTIHLQRIWLDIIVCKLTTSYVQHWSKVRNLKIFQYTFHATLQHLLSEETLLVNYVLDTANLN